MQIQVRRVYCRTRTASVKFSKKRIFLELSDFVSCLVLFVFCNCSFDALKKLMPADFREKVQVAQEND